MPCHRLLVSAAGPISATLNLSHTPPPYTFYAFGGYAGNISIFDSLSDPNLYGESPIVSSFGEMMIIGGSSTQTADLQSVVNNSLVAIHHPIELLTVVYLGAGPANLLCFTVI